MNDDDRTTLEAWVVRVADALNTADLDLDLDEVLNLAGTAARSIVRPAAPVTTFLVGYAAGRATAAGANPKQAVRDATATVEALAAS